MIHIKIQTHVHAFVDLYFEQMPTHEELLKTIDICVAQYILGAPTNYKQTGYWASSRNINRWKRAFKIVRSVAEQRFNDEGKALAYALTGGPELEIVKVISSPFSGGYDITIKNIHPLLGITDTRLNPNIPRLSV
jgi:hypothetical protein